MGWRRKICTGSGCWEPEVLGDLVSGVKSGTLPTLLLGWPEPEPGTLIPSFLPQNPACFWETLQPKGALISSSHRELGHPSPLPSPPSWNQDPGSHQTPLPQGCQPPSSRAQESGTPAPCCPRGPGIWAEVWIPSVSLAGLGAPGPEAQLPLNTDGFIILEEQVLVYSLVLLGGQRGRLLQKPEEALVQEDVLGLGRGRGGGEGCPPELWPA